MNPSQPKTASLRLDPELYEPLRQHVLQRDGWRCQACGAMSQLEVHHQQFRSHSGEDSEQNLITLCAACHAAITSPLHGLTGLFTQGIALNNHDRSPKLRSEPVSSGISAHQISP